MLLRLKTNKSSSLLFLLFCATSYGKFEVYESKDGRMVSAELIGVTETKATLQLPNGKRHTVSRRIFAAKEQARFDAALKSKGSHPAPPDYEILLQARVYSKDDANTVDPTYVHALADTRSWKYVLSKSPYLYFGIGRLGEREMTDEVMAQLTKIVQDNRLRVSVEVGGLRFVNAAAFNDQSGERHARKELKKLMRWIRAGGTINEITADHAIMHHIAMNHRNKVFRVQKTEPLPEDKKHLKFTWDGLYNELMDYFLTVKGKIPDCSFGVVASLGYFTIHDKAGNKYGPKGLPEWDYGEYINGLLAATEKNGVTISHVDVDASYTSAWLHALKSGKKGIEVERIAMAVRAIQSRGLKAGLFFQGSVNWKFIKKHIPDIEEDDSFDVCVGRLKEFVSALHEAGVKPDRIVVRRSKEMDYTHGAETQDGTYFHMVKQLLEEKERVEE